MPAFGFLHFAPASFSCACRLKSKVYPILYKMSSNSMRLNSPFNGVFKHNNLSKNYGTLPTSKNFSIKIQSSRDESIHEDPNLSKRIKLIQSNDTKITTDFKIQNEAMFKVEVEKSTQVLAETKSQIENSKETYPEKESEMEKSNHVLTETKIQIESQTKSQIQGPLAKTAFQPFLVKKDKKFPSNWDGPGGTVALIDKPKGWTSFAVCGKLRKILGIKKVGHAGTLDPLATGLLIVCLGKATKLADSYQAMTKVYSGTMRLGESTPSYDSDTPVNSTLPWDHVTEEMIEKCKIKFLGDIFQVPPMYSAIKVKGEKMYEKARKGESIDLPPRPVSIFSFQTKRDEKDGQNFHFHVVCSKGTYIRSLCYDLGKELNTCAHLVALRRENIGDYSVQDAFTMADLEKEITNQKQLNGIFSQH